eukprot:TRINITY_DN23613_c0_g1_i1.p2 TRINITY_DN23613_c0_g1~~TRINITY_DN23613_c0_g1_i1.p2  ORF type:complete len:139 (-),score=1.45 TRINITY_DN23613_c0_g1_i1:178-594(-)
MAVLLLEGIESATGPLPSQSRLGHIERNPDGVGVNVGAVRAGIFEVLNPTPDAFLEELRLPEALEGLVVEGPFLQAGGVVPRGRRQRDEAFLVAAGGEDLSGIETGPSPVERFGDLPAGSGFESGLVGGIGTVGNLPG